VATEELLCPRVIIPIAAPNHGLSDFKVHFASVAEPSWHVSYNNGRAMGRNKQRGENNNGCPSILVQDMYRGAPFVGQLVGIGLWWIRQVGRLVREFKRSEYG
jgi:hypothetical protein